MPTLQDDPTLEDFQRYVAELEGERGFENQTATEKCLLLGEEIGELFKAVRRSEGLKVDPASPIGEIEHELADVFIYVCAIANRYGIGLEEAFRSKEALNHQRRWFSEEEMESHGEGGVSH
ncbi:pyrophosphohydrolase [Candidatus Bipolaricaulota bacterium]|nr:pyrophosphohydrolase [Candidatus Bipolaricaulota bacterium]